MRLINADAYAYPGDLVNEPTIDAVEVVRCFECVRRGDPGECPMCFFSDGDWDDYTNDNGYCDRGEREEENATD